MFCRCHQSTSLYLLCLQLMPACLSVRRSAISVDTYVLVYVWWDYYGETATIVHVDNSLSEANLSICLIAMQQSNNAVLRNVFLGNLQF